MRVEEPWRSLNVLDGVVEILYGGVETLKTFLMVRWRAHPRNESHRDSPSPYAV